MTSYARPIFMICVVLFFLSLVQTLPAPFSHNPRTILNEAEKQGSNGFAAQGTDNLAVSGANVAQKDASNNTEKQNTLFKAPGSGGLDTGTILSQGSLSSSTDQQCLESNNIDAEKNHSAAVDANTNNDASNTLFTS